MRTVGRSLGCLCLLVGVAEGCALAFGFAYSLVAHLVQRSPLTDAQIDAAAPRVTLAAYGTSLALTAYVARRRWGRAATGGRDA